VFERMGEGDSDRLGMFLRHFGFGEDGGLGREEKDFEEIS
jgi:hypothetical protein